MVPFESLGMDSYSYSIITMALSCIISEIKLDIGQKFSYLPLQSTPLLGGIPVEVLPAFDTEKLEW